MKKCSEPHIVSEYGLLYCDESIVANSKYTSKQVSKETYNELIEFAKTDYGQDIFRFYGSGKALQAKNYVGTIQTKSGYTIEILPKIYNKDKKTDNSKEIFLQLLRILYKLPSFKHVENAKFKHEKMPLLEIFIEMFLQEIRMIIKKGIKSNYINTEDNLHAFKGKLLINQNLQKNYIHKERFYVSYDEYRPNRVENRLIKSTLKYLAKVSTSYHNIRLIRMYHEKMNSIDYSSNIDTDFKRSQTKVRGMESYRKALIWAKIFLKKDSFTQFSGDTVAFAILYPMEKLFEAYVEYYLRDKYKYNLNVSIEPQASEEVFVHKNMFTVRPDFIIKKNEKILIVADAKWKIINLKDSENTFSQSDFYQLFAYKEIYKKKNTCRKVGLKLYYPMNENFTEKSSFEFFDQEKIKVIPLDMNDIIPLRDAHEPK